MPWLLSAGIIGRGSFYDSYLLPLVLVFAAVGGGARYWRFFAQWLNEIRGRDWTSTPAVIDVVSVVEQTEDTRHGERHVGYLATLTYFYRNPELQMGEYSKMFAFEAEARAWTEPLKGRTVMVHVDPREPSRSALFEGDLEAITLPIPSA
jgi:hypothetical protein